MINASFLNFLSPVEAPVNNVEMPSTDITRLNSGDFSKFFLCSDIIFLTYSLEKTHLIVPKHVEICQYCQHFETATFDRLGTPAFSPLRTVYSVR